MAYIIRHKDNPRTKNGFSKYFNAPLYYAGQLEGFAFYEFSKDLAFQFQDKQEAFHTIAIDMSKDRYNSGERFYLVDLEDGSEVEIPFDELKRESIEWEKAECLDESESVLV